MQTTYPLAGEPCDSKLQQQPADCEDSPLLQFQLPDATLFNDSLDDDLNPDLLLEAKLPTESAAMECTDGYMPTVRVNLNDSLCCEDMDETQLPLGCDNELTTEDDKMEDSVKQKNLNDSLECEDMDETQLPLGGGDGGPVDTSADKATSRVQETKLNDSLGCIDMDETQLNEDIGSSTTSSADKQAVSASELSDDSTLDQTAQCDGTKCLISDKKISSSLRDDKCATAETQQTVQPESTEHRTSSSAVAKPAPTAGAKVKPSFSKKKSFVAPKTKTTPSTTNELPKPTVNSKPKKDKPKKSSPSSAKSPGFVAPPSTNVSPSSSYATTPDTNPTDTDDTEDCSVSNKSTDTEKSIKVQSGGKSTDKSIKSKHTKLTEKKVEQSAKKQEKEELKKERILKKQELERKRAEKEQLKQEKRLEQERKKAQREQMKMEKELKKLEQEKIRAEKFATAQKKKTKSQTKSKTKTTEKKASGITGDELGSDTSRQCEDSEISAEDTTKSADNNDQTEPEHHDEKASCDTDVQQISNEHAEPLIHSPSTSSKNGFENNQKEDEITVPPLNETATPLTVDSENAAVTSTDTDKPSPNEDSKIEQSSTDEESDSTNTPLSKLAVTKPDQPKTKVASKMFSPPKQQKDKKAKGLKKKSLNSHTPTKPAKTSKKKQPLKQPSTIANVQKGKKRKASIESVSEGGPQPKRSKSANYSGPVWVQCESSDCKKWRQLKDCQDPALVPDKWTCSMNSDENYSSCCAPEEQWSDFGDSQEFVESPFVPGSIVWAKMDGYPW